MEENKSKQVEEQQQADTQNEVESKTYTQKELDKLLQQESDRRVTQARAKFEEDYQAKLEAEKNQAAELAKLSEEERFKEELKLEREKFEAERNEFKKVQLEAETIKQLSSHKLPTEFATYLLADDAETIKTNIEQFNQQWINAIEQAVNERLKGSTPTASNVSSRTMTKEEFGKLSSQERTKMYSENPDLVKQILNK